MNTNEFVTDGWRDDAVSPDLKATVLAKLGQREKARHKYALAFGFLATGAGVVALSGVFLFGTPTVTLAQVMAASSKVDSYTVTNRRIMGPDKGNGFSFIMRVSGDAVCQTEKSGNPWKGDGSFGYIDKTGSLTYFANLKIALLDNRERNIAEFIRIPEISSMLKDFKASKVEQGFEYEGRKVTRFTFKRKVHDYDIDQELLADPKTNLPIKFTSMRDSRSWGDEWIYDYTPIDRSTIKPSIPVGAETIDLVPQRVRFAEILTHSKSDVPTFLSSPLHETVLIVRSKAVKEGQLQAFSVLAKSKLTGKTKSFKGYVDFMGRGEFTIGGQDYLSLKLQTEEDRNQNAFDASDTLSGSVLIDNYKKKMIIPFENVSGLKVGFEMAITAPFRKTYKAPKLGYQGK